MEIQDQIKINGKIYRKDNLYALKDDFAATDLWMQDIQNFLTDWFDNSEVIITHTSGSTGLPKEIRLTKQAMRNSARMTNSFLELNASHTALLCLPATYIAGKMMLIRAIEGKYNLICLEPKANPFEDISIAIDFTAITPYQLSFSLETLRNRAIRNIIVGGGHINSTLELLAQDIPAHLYETYGMTETASHIALRKLNGANSEFFTTLPGVAIRQNKKNCLIISAPHLSPIELVTNDIVELLDEKTFKWLGRADSVINTGGIKIFPEQVEKKLEKLIEEPFFISSIPDDALGQKIILVIECPNHLATEYMLKIDNNSTNLGKYEVPKEIFTIEKFSYSISNKVLKNETLDRIINRK